MNPQQTYNEARDQYPEIEHFKHLFMKYPEIIPKHEASLDPINPQYQMANNSMTIICAPAGSGKSWLLRDILNKVPHEIVFMVGPTASFDQTAQDRPINCIKRFTADGAEIGVKKLFKFLYTRFIIDKLVTEFDETDSKEKQKRLLKEIDKMCDGEELNTYSLSHRVMIILDDCGYASKEMKNKDSPLTKLVMIRRHLGVSIIACLQSWKQIDVDIKRNTTDLLLHKDVSPADLEDIQKVYGRMQYKTLYLTPEPFKAAVYGLLGDEPHSFIHFVYRGVYKNFKPLSRDDVDEAITDYLAMKKGRSERVKQRINEKLNNKSLSIKDQINNYKQELKDASPKFKNVIQSIITQLEKEA